MKTPKNVTGLRKEIVALRAAIGMLAVMVSERETTIAELIDAAEHPDGRDSAYKQAKVLVRKKGTATTAYLQKELGIGYSRAAKIIDLLEEDGIVGAGNGAKPRLVKKG